MKLSEMMERVFFGLDATSAYSIDSAVSISTCAAEDGDKPLSLVETLKLVRSFPPTIRAIWFIDRADHYYRFMEHYEPADCSLCGAMHGRLDIHNCTQAEIEERIETLVADSRDGQLYRSLIERGLLYPFRVSGIWVEMSNRQHIHLIPIGDGRFYYVVPCSPCRKAVGEI